MPVHLEHANLIVRDLNATVRFSSRPLSPISGCASTALLTRTANAGCTSAPTIPTSLLTQATSDPGPRWTPYAGVPGVNHLAYEVDDVDALRGRLSAAGYRDSTVPNHHPYRKRVYFYDTDGNDWEFVQYLSDDPAKRHDYAIPDK